MAGPEMNWQGRAALVTGGTGFIGGALVARLAELGAQVIVPTRNRARIGKSGHPHVRHIHSADMVAALAEVSAVFNLAYDFRRSAEENMALYAKTADACAAAKVPMLVQASSIAVYDDWPVRDVTEASPCDGPGHDYKIAKRAIERDIAARVSAGQFDAVILQPTIVYGPGSAQWVDALVEKMAGGSVILPENGDGLCNGLYIDDLVNAFIAAAGLERGNAERFIVSGPQPFLWNTLFTSYAEACGAEILYEKVVPYVPSAPRPSSRLSALVRYASATAAGLIGTARLEALRARLMALKPGPRIFMPASDNPRLYLSRGIASTEKMRAQLHQPQIGAEEGLRRTQAYIRAKYAAKG
jgi:nucleoside-diphosphate-sugar epimerase